MSPVREVVWIARLSVSDATRAKVAGKHGVPVGVLRAHLVGRTHDVRWDVSPVRGRRAIVTVTLHGRRIVVVLYAAPDHGEDCWRLASAYYA